MAIKTDGEIFKALDAVEKSTRLDEIKAFCLINYKREDFLQSLETEYGGEIMHTGGGCMVWGYCYDLVNFITVNEESFGVTRDCVNFDERCGQENRNRHVQ